MHGLHRLAPMPPPLCSRPGFLRPTSTTPLGLAPSRQARIHRHRVRMTTTPEPGRLPSDQPRPCGRSGPDCARFSHLHVPAPHPCRLPRSDPASSKRRGGRFRLPLAVKRALQPASSLPGKMRITDVCNRLTTRAPCEPFDSRLRLQKASRPPFVRPPAAWASGFTWVEHRLTATLQLRLSTRMESRRKRRFYPELGMNQIPLGPGGCRDRRPLRRYPPATVFSTASRAGDVASDAPVAPDDLRTGFHRADLRRTPDPLPPPSRQRQQLSQAGAPSIDECSLRPLAQTSRGARHRSHDFAVAIRLPAPFCRSARERLDPLPFDKGPDAARRLLQSTQSASTTDRIV